MCNSRLFVQTLRIAAENHQNIRLLFSSLIYKKSRWQLMFLGTPVHIPTVANKNITSQRDDNCSLN